MITWFIICGYLIGLNILVIGYSKDMFDREIISRQTYFSLYGISRVTIALLIITVLTYAFLLSTSVFKLCLVYTAIVILGRNIKPFILGPVTIVYFTAVLVYIRYFLM